MQRVMNLPLARKLQSRSGGPCLIYFSRFFRCSNTDAQNKNLRGRTEKLWANGYFLNKETESSPIKTDLQCFLDFYNSLHTTEYCPISAQGRQSAISLCSSWENLKWQIRGFKLRCASFILFILCWKINGIRSPVEHREQYTATVPCTYWYHKVAGTAIRKHPAITQTNNILM